MSASDATAGRTQSAAQTFRSETNPGVLLHPRGGRIALLSRDVIRELHSGVIATFPDLAQDILYRSGYEWALRTMAELNRQLLTGTARVPGPLEQLEPQSTLDAWWSLLAECGWGAASFDCAPLTRGVMQVQLSRSIVADAFGRAEDPVCHLYAGLFAGALSFIARAERHSTEIECCSQGAATCRFVVGPGAEVDAAETWRQRQVPPDEIARRMR